MTNEVNKLIANVLAAHGTVTIPGVGTLYVAHAPAERISRRRIAAPRNRIDFRSAEDGAPLGALIARAARCDEAKGAEIALRWRAKVSTPDGLTIEGIGTLRGKSFRTDEAFERLLNPVPREQALKPRRSGMHLLIVGIAAVAILFGAGALVYVSTVHLPDPGRRLLTDDRIARRIAERQSDLQQEETASAAPEESDPAAARPAAETPAPELSETPAPQPVPAATTSPAAPAAMQSGWNYLVLGVFSTEANAERCCAEARRADAALAPAVYRFGEKWMVSICSSQDAEEANRMKARYAGTFEGLWIYRKK